MVFEPFLEEDFITSDRPPATRIKTKNEQIIELILELTRGPEGITLYFVDIKHKKGKRTG